MSGPEASSGKSDTDDSQWVFPDREANEDEIGRLLGLALEVGVRTSFKLHCYKFGGHVYNQVDGGPIGMKLTMSVSRIVMADWGLRAREILTEAGFRVFMLTSYVDDIRLVVDWIPAGYYYNQAAGRIIYDEALTQVHTDEDKT